MPSKRLRTSRLIPVLLAGAAALAAGLPALGQEAPESLLPPGFGQPQPGAPAGPVRPQPTAAPSDPLAEPLPGEGDPALEEEGEEEEKEPPVELPDAARRSIELVGPLTRANGGLGMAAWGRSSGRFLTAVMERLDTPVASRWTSILLRRALLTRTPTPANVAPADWVAARAGLLLRLGEADGARMLVESVDTDRFSPRLLIVARQTALATADPVALCPLTERAGRMLKEQQSWNYVRAICAAMSGEGSVSTMYLDRALGRSYRTIDHHLAEKLVGAAGNTRRAATVEWVDADRLTPWRFGLASAVGLEVPDDLYASASPFYQAWRARAPMLTPESRIGAARIAATLGVFSNSALVDLYGQWYEREGEVDRDAPTARLRAAYVGDDQLARMVAIRSFWEESEDQPGGLYAAQILTARAAARLTPDDSFSADYERLIASMLSAGLDIQAARWAPLVEASSPSIGDDAWALLAVGAPRAVVELGYARIDGYGARLGAGGAARMRVLIAALAGLGRISEGDRNRLADRYDLPITAQNAYTRMIDRAAARGEDGTVALLAAIGMQTPNWQHVPPVHLYHIIAALRRVGNEPVARMIAAEALSRL